MFPNVSYQRTSADNVCCREWSRVLISLSGGPLSLVSLLSLSGLSAVSLEGCSEELLLS